MNERNSHNNGFISQIEKAMESVALWRDTVTFSLSPRKPAHNAKLAKQVAQSQGF